MRSLTASRTLTWRDAAIGRSSSTRRPPTPRTPAVRYASTTPAQAHAACSQLAAPVTERHTPRRLPRKIFLDSNATESVRKLE
jgi:hypothetical protein